MNKKALLERPKKYVIIFVKLVIFSAALAWLPAILKLGILNGTIFTILWCISFSITMAAIFIPIDYFSTRELPPAALDIRQDRDIQLHGNIEQMFMKTLDLLKGIKSIKKIRPLKEKLTISARTKEQCPKLGLKITLQFDVLSHDSIMMHIKSRRFGLLDKGNHFKTIEYLSKEIREKIGGN
jgi:hypothetical protein